MVKSERLEVEHIEPTPGSAWLVGIAAWFIPGSGHVEWKSVFQALKDVKYDGWLTIESFGFALPNLSAAAAIWRDIEASPESIAVEGVKFLKKNI